MVALTACMRNLIVILNGNAKSQQPWNPGASCRDHLTPKTDAQFDSTKLRTQMAPGDLRNAGCKDAPRIRQCDPLGKLVRASRSPTRIRSQRSVFIAKSG